MSNELTQTKNEITYKVGGQEIKLSPTIVSQFITKGDASITQQEAVNFMMLCKYAELNPFLNEAYIVKFGNKPAQLITSKEAFMKRAERQPSYKGNKAGIVVLDKNGDIIEREGTIYTKNEELLGGWAKVFRENREETYISINFKEFAKYKYNGDLQATWAQMPANMIRKSALVNALREAYPDQLGAMYTEDDADLNIDRKVVNQTSKADDTTSELIEQLKDEKGQSEEDTKEDEETPVEEIEAIDGDFEEVNEGEDSSETVEEIKKFLDKNEVDYPSKAKKTELERIKENFISERRGEAYEGEQTSLI